MVIEKVFSKRRFFPLFSWLKLRNEKGSRWAELVDDVNALNISEPRVIAFNLTIDRLRRLHGNYRSTCHDRFCATCVAEVVAEFRGSEDDLIAFYHQNLDEVTFELRSMKARNAAVRADRMVTRQETLAA